MLVPMAVMFHLMAAGHHEDPAVQSDHVDFGSIQARQDGAGDNLVDRAKRRLAATQIEHAVERSEQRVQLVGGEQHGDSKFGLQGLHQRDHLMLVMGIEADQRLIEQQQPRAANERLGEQQALPFAAGSLRQRPPSQIPGADKIKRPIDLGPRRLANHRQAQAMPIDHAGDEIPAAQPHAIGHAAGLGHVADSGIAPCGRLAEDADRAAVRGHQPEDPAHQRGLAGAVRAKDTDKLVRGDRQADTGQDDTLAKHQPDIEELDRVHRGAWGKSRPVAPWGTARPIASSWVCIHAW
jgi:hypothetical protein